MFDLCCGLGGATEGFLAEGWECIGIDIERHIYGEHRYPAQLWIQNLLTIDGAQLRDANCLWASVPCQEFSYMAMPWSRAKQIERALRGEDEFPEGYQGSRTLAELTALFDACFRIQREACEAAGHHIPLIVENVRGAQKWVGRARWHFGSFYLWGDAPALMPPIVARKSSGLNWSDRSKPCDYTREAGKQAIKNSGGSWFAVAHNTTSGKGRNPVCGIKEIPHRTAGHWTNPAEHEGVKQTGSGRAWWDKALDERRKAAPGTKVPGGGSEGWFGKNASPMRRHHSGSSKRKAASAMIAKIPLPLAQYIGRVFHP